MIERQVKRYNSIAIGLHWLIAFFLLGLLVVGKYMTSLTDSDPLRYTLTQWHKSFGITVLILAVFRLLWRITHKPPALPDGSTFVERFGSHAVHVLLYLLMVVIPLSGWVMVSASPLNLKTELFGVIPWPHIGWVESIANKELIAEQSHQAHEWMANILIVLAVLHIVAAFFHQLIKKDRLISRMIVADDHVANGDLKLGLLGGVLLAGACTLFLANYKNESLVAGVAASSVGDEQQMAATVGFVAMQMGEPVNGRFQIASVDLTLDPTVLSAATLNAQVDTGSVKTGDSQVDLTVVTEEWFASTMHPHATFESTGFVAADSGKYIVSGNMTIRGITQVIEFTMSPIDPSSTAAYHGALIINRSDYKIGDGGQDGFVAPEVEIIFSVANTFGS